VNARLSPPPEAPRPALTLVTGGEQDVRGALMRLAHGCLNDQITDVFAATALRGIAPDLTEERRWECFEELLDAVALVDAVQCGYTHWSELIPDATGTNRDEQAADEAQTRVDLALDEIVGGG
jgi:hypothetical protein